MYSQEVSYKSNPGKPISLTLFMLFLQIADDQTGYGDATEEDGNADEVSLAHCHFKLMKP
jgi:hypothetical protein